MYFSPCVDATNDTLALYVRNAHNKICMRCSICIESVILHGINAHKHVVHMFKKLCLHCARHRCSMARQNSIPRLSNFPMYHTISDFTERKSTPNVWKNCRANVVIYSHVTSVCLTHIESFTLHSAHVYGNNTSMHVRRNIWTKLTSALMYKCSSHSCVVQQWFSIFF